MSSESGVDIAIPKTKPKKVKGSVMSGIQRASVAVQVEKLLRIKLSKFGTGALSKKGAAPPKAVPIIVPMIAPNTAPARVILY
jgi:hypothetical protein